MEGSDDYSVTVIISDDGEISDTECDCPFDMGIYCKHQVAVFYAIRDKLRSGEVPKNTEKRESLEEVLEKLDRRVLIAMVLEFAGRDKRMKEEVLLRHSGNADPERVRGIIKSAIAATEHRGYIGYYDTERATKGTDIALKMAEDEISTGEIMTAVRLCIVVLEETMDLLRRCDDSDGYVGETIEDTIAMIGEAIMAQNAHEDSEMIFDAVLEHSQSSIYDDWDDWQIDLMSALVPLCGNRANRDKLEKVISDSQSADVRGWSGEYRIRSLQNLQFSIIREFDDESAADIYIEGHLDNDDLRVIGIENAIRRRSYEKALSMCIDGETKSGNYIGLLKEYRDIRYGIYEKTEDIEAQKDLGFELLIGGDISYLSKIKALYGEDGWPAVLRKIVNATKAGDRKGIYLETLIREGLKSELLEYCKENVSYIVPLYPNLLPEYKKDVCEIFVSHIRGSAAHANGRDDYRSVCRTLWHYKSICGDGAYTLRDELARTYARRPAFTDELSKFERNAYG